MSAPLDWLMSAEAVRSRAGQVMAAGEAGKLAHFALDLGRLDVAAEEVVSITRETYPDLRVPYHSRWRHFSVGGIDRWAGAIESRRVTDARERARMGVELAITSVLLDAGAGTKWSYLEAASGQRFSRSEGLAVASFDLYLGGGFSARRDHLPRADAKALKSFSSADLTAAFQVGESNPLEGVEGRARLIRGLGEVVAGRADIFGAEGRLGGLFDFLASRAAGGGIEAERVLAIVLDALGPIWPGRILREGRNLGDVWPHPAVSTGDAEDPTDGLVPFHKLSQWLTYSLLEPLEQAGLRVERLDGLTGLPEYRNGGLFIDTGVLRPRDPSILATPQPAGAEAVVEWRALTVALLDRLAPLVRDRLGLSAESFPLACMLQGGSWAAGRRLAESLRGGAPPIRLESDGTVF